MSKISRCRHLEYAENKWARKTSTKSSAKISLKTKWQKCHYSTVQPRAGLAGPAIAGKIVPLRFPPNVIDGEWSGINFRVREGSGKMNGC